MARMNLSTEIGGRSIAGTITRSGGVESSYRTPTPLAAGKTGTLTTRTDANTGTLTMDSGHGIQTGDIVDIYWDGGVQRNVTVGTVATNSVPFDLGTGDDLPIATTAVVVGVQTEVDFDIEDGDTLILVAASHTRRGLVQFKENDDTLIVAIELGANAEGEGWFWASDNSDANPFTGVGIGKVTISNGASTGTAYVSFGCVCE